MQVHVACMGLAERTQFGFWFGFVSPTELILWIGIKSWGRKYSEPQHWGLMSINGEGTLVGAIRVLPILLSQMNDALRTEEPEAMELSNSVLSYLSDGTVPTVSSILIHWLSWYHTTTSAEREKTCLVA